MPAVAATPETGAVPPPPPGEYPVRRRPTPWTVLLVSLVAVVLVLVVCGGVLLAILGPAFQRARDEAARDTCARNLQLIHNALVMYANENLGYYPPPSTEHGRVMLPSRALHPEYIVDTDVFVCSDRRDGEEPPAPPADDFDDESYAYLSHALLNEDQGMAYVESLRRAWTNGGTVDDDVPLAGDERLWRLRLGVERLLAADPLNPEEVEVLPARIPVLVEWPGHHASPGGNVLYLDGHVEFVPYPGPFPMSPAFIEALQALAGWNPRPTQPPAP